MGFRPPAVVRLPDPARLGYLVAAVVGAGMYAFHEWAGPEFQHDVRTGMVFLGAALGLTYLAVQLGRALRPGSPGDGG